MFWKRSNARRKAKSVLQDCGGVLCEPLESRRLLTTLTITPVGTTLNVTGDDSASAESIVMKEDGLGLYFIYQGSTLPVHYSGFTNVVMAGRGGPDTITVDTSVNSSYIISISGGDGSDSLTGGTGNDTITGNTGNDTLVGGAGSDSLSGLNGDDSLVGQDGNDTLDGGDGADWIGGGHHDDLLSGGIGNDTLDGGTGSDNMYGGDDDDRFFAQDGEVDFIDGGAGNDAATTFDTFDTRINM
jgi:Ca2+-binding RTX toxin-like protein